MALSDMCQHCLLKNIQLTLLVKGGSRAAVKTTNDPVIFLYTSIRRKMTLLHVRNVSFHKNESLELREENVE